MSVASLRLDFDIETQLKIFLPQGPWKIKDPHSKYRDVSLEILMFRDYMHLQKMIEHMHCGQHQRMSDLHLHLAWLLNRGEDRLVRVECSFCQKKPASHFFFFGNYSGHTINPNNVCCYTCRYGFMFTSAPDYYPIKFSSISRFDHVIERRLFVQALKDVCCLPHHLRENQAFAFFNAPGIINPR